MLNGAARRARVALPATLLAFVCLSCCATAEGGRVIPLSELVPSKAELPGFIHATTKVWSTTSVLEWAKSGEPSAPPGAVNNLRAEGFQEGIEKGYFLLPSREALASASVFASAAGAEHELRASVAEAMRTFEQAGLKRSTVHAIPGSVGLGSFRPGHRGGTGNVFFVAGRCFFVIGNRFVDATSRAQANLAPVAAAQTLYRRDRQLCA